MVQLNLLGVGHGVGVRSALRFKRWVGASDGRPLQLQRSYHEEYAGDWLQFLKKIILVPIQSHEEYSDFFLKVSGTSGFVPNITSLSYQTHPTSTIRRSGETQRV